jgi:glycosyltransferase involved in cell wall biosynthesis
MSSICHIITGLNRGGAERSLYTLLESGLQKHFRNRVVSLLDMGVYGTSFSDIDVPVSSIGMRRGRISLKNLMHLKRDLFLDPPDILQGWMYHGNLAAAFGSRVLATRPMLSWNIRCDVGSRTDVGTATSVCRYALKTTSATPDAIIYNSTNARWQHSVYGFADSKARVIPNGFDLEKWRPDEARRQATRMALNLPEKAQVIGYIGRNHPQKDLATLFCAISEIQAAGLTPYVVLVGANLEAALPSGSALQNLIFLGERSDLPQLLPAFDLLCLSSKAEGFPNVLGEAMASGVPCITTDAGEAPHIVGDTGWIVPRQNPVELAAALRQALATEAQDLAKRGAAARHRIKAAFSIEATLRQYSELYQDLSARRMQCVA